MANLARVRVSWSGVGIVGPAVSTFYYAESGSGWTTDLLTFFTAIKAYFPATMGWQVAGTGDILDDASGDLVGTWTETAPAQVLGSANNQVIGGVGARIVWKTGGFRNGRRVTGATFLTGADGTMFDVVGTLNNAAVTTITTAANALNNSTANELRIWSRPSPGTEDGASWPVLAAVVPDKVSWLRSRRT
jgi:hypothetical protein